MKKLIENEHALTTPQLIGTDEEKIVGIRYWSEVIALIRSINTTFVSYENKRAVLDAFKNELQLIEIELDNTTSRVTQGGGEIPSADQNANTSPNEVNVVDLTKTAAVAATVAPPLGSKAPTFENLDKLRRVAGVGVWDKNHGPIFNKKK